jgi:hypothetical protein
LQNETQASVGRVQASFKSSDEKATPAALAGELPNMVVAVAIIAQQ